MLERFIRFLRASLEATRAETTTLAAEGDLISAYLDVLQVRMGSRLKPSVDIAPGGAGTRVTIEMASSEPTPTAPDERLVSEQPDE